MGREVGDDGFTLVELLIVIVILGILATITTIAVRGISDKGQESACAAELQTLVTAEESHNALFGSFGTSAELATNGLMAGESALYAITIDAGGGYTIAPASGSTCTATVSAAASSGPPSGGPDRSTYAVAVASSSFGTFHTNPGSYQVTPDPGEPNEVLVFGRTNGLLGWHDMLNAPQPNTQRVTFINLDNATEASIRYAISQSRNNGATTVGYFPSDDPGAAAYAIIEDEWLDNADPDDRTLEALVAAPASGKTLTQLLNQIG